MSQNSDDLTTQPTATALMEQAREVEVRLARDIASLAARLEDQTTRSEAQTIRLEAQFSALREEIVSSVQRTDLRFSGRDTEQRAGSDLFVAGRYDEGLLQAQ